MPNQETRELQLLAVTKLRELFDPVVKEWHPFNHQGLSSPIIDVAVGPFATEERLIQPYNQLFSERDVRALLNRFLNFHFENLDRFHVRTEYTRENALNDMNNINQNSRCFIAIEIEGRIDRKVVLADIANTAAMGRFGIIVAKTEQVLTIFIRLLVYFDFLRKAGKPGVISTNVMILSKEQFETIINEL